MGDGDGDGEGATVVVVVLSGTGVGDGAGVVVVDVVVVLLSGIGVGFTVVVVVVVVVVVLVVVVLVSGLSVVVVELSGTTVVVFLSSIAIGVVDVGSGTTAAGATPAWSAPDAAMAMARQDTPTTSSTSANLDDVIIFFMVKLGFLLSKFDSAAKMRFQCSGGGRAGNRSIDWSRPRFGSFVLQHAVRRRRAAGIQVGRRRVPNDFFRNLFGCGDY